jgi:hypothetical protein
MRLRRIGVDLAKNVFQIHGVDSHERPVWRNGCRENAGCKRCLKTSSRAVRSGWKVAVVHTIGHGNCRRRDIESSSSRHSSSNRM